MKPKEVIKTKANSVKDILAFVKLHKKEFYRNVKEQWGTRLFHSLCATTGWQAELKKHYIHTDPNKGDEYLAIGRAIQHWFEVIPPFPIFLMVISKLHMRHSEKITAKWEVKKPRATMMNWTNITKELLERGYINAMDFIKWHEDVIEKKKEKGLLLLICQETFLVYPNLFFNKEDAEKVEDTHGIPHITKLVSELSDLSDLDEETAPF